MPPARRRGCSAIGRATSFATATPAIASPTALELGNSPTVLQVHYQELATPGDAAAWFVVKRQETRNVVRFAKRCG